MNLRKRTEQEINESVKNGDATGGYGFMAWLIWMRFSYLFSAMLLLAAGIAIIKTLSDDRVYFYGGLFACIGSYLIFMLLVRDFKDGKKGISR